MFRSQTRQYDESGFMMFWDNFLDWGKKPAIISHNNFVSYMQLAQMCDQFSEFLPQKKSLVLVNIDSSIESIAALYGTLRSGHVALLCDPGNQLLQQSLINTYSPDFFYTKQSSLWKLIKLRKERDYDLNKDLALMLSTSGSTGNSKCVRLSINNINSNTKSIVKYLNIDQNENTALILPLHYCYGLSILNTHLSIGASIHVEGLSVEKSGFVEYLKDHQITSFSGVPYTFELLERIKFRSEQLSGLRYVAQAGGKLRRPLVTSYTKWAKTNNKKFYVMYGQTEATARIAYMPPEVLEEYPHCIGIAIPGGKLSIHDEYGNKIEKIDSPGELIYQGSNVMMGYAETALDLAKGSELSQLKTGDLACVNNQGFFYIIGRLKRFCKIYGKRYNLDDIEKYIHAYDHTAVCTSDDEILIIGSENKNINSIVDSVSKEYGIAPIHIETIYFSSLPRLTSGKVDYQTILQSFTSKKLKQNSQALKTNKTDNISNLLLEVYTKTFTGTTITKDDSFSDLGGDSLTYVSVSIDIENILGKLPKHWEKKSIRQLSKTLKNEPTTATSSVETGILIRVYAIMAIVIGHAGFKGIEGGAALLILLSGINFARFHLNRLLTGKPFGLFVSVFKNILVPYWALLLAWNIHKRAFEADLYELLLVHNFISDNWRLPFYTWFIQALVQSIVLVSVPLMITRIRNWASTNVLLYGVYLFAFATLLRIIDEYFRFEPHQTIDVQRTFWAFWLFCIGILIFLANNRKGKIIITTVIAVWAFMFYHDFPHFLYGDYPRITTIIIGSILVIWVDKVNILKPLVPIVKVIGSASLFIYLMHKKIIITRFLPDVNIYNTALIKIIAGVLQGIIAWKVYIYIEAFLISMFSKKQKKRFASIRRDEEDQSLIN